MALNMKICAPLVTALCFVSFLAHAKNNYNRPYIGIGLGAAQQNSKYSYDLNVAVPGMPLYLNMPKKGNNSAQAFSGNLNIGYSKLISSKGYIAVEAQANLRPLNNKFSANSYSNAVGQAVTVIDENHSIKQLSPSFVLALKPGILLSPASSVYSILGTEITRFRVASQGRFSISLSGGGSGNIATSDSKSYTRCGLLFGLGVDRYIDKKLRMGFEYNYVDYGNSSTGFSGNNANGTVALSNNLRVQTHSLLAKLTYDL